MKAKIIRAMDVKEDQFGVLTVKQYFNDKNLENMSLAQIKRSGKNRVVTNKDFDSMYFIVDGTGSFFIDGKRKNVKKDDLIVIPKGVTYQDEGEMTMLCFNNPRWRSEE